ncbi:MAG: hypothetical protein AAGK05_04110 [Pseudomonadota bacterium]
MKIDDQTLSAFLDNELPANEMKAIRNAIAEDEQLALRLAELCEVDMLVKQHAAQIDIMPLSDELAQTIEQHNKENVVSLSKWQQIKLAGRKQMAVAASIAVLFTVAIASFVQQQGLEQPIANALDQKLSGDNTVIDTNRSLTAQLSFVNTNGDFCRQYTLYSKSTQQTHIACKQQGIWQLHASSEQRAMSSQSYRLASKTPALDSYIDEHIQGQPLDRNAEQQALTNHWQ